MKVYLQLPNASVIYWPAENCVELVMKGLMYSDEFRQVMNTALEAMREERTGKLLGDMSQGEAIDPDDQEWVATQWAQEAVAVGFRYNAIVVPVDVFGRMSMEGITENRQVVSVRYFDDKQAARNWLATL